MELVQLFPAAAYAKNGADIRLAVDTVEDLYLLPDLTHVVIVAGDSDYVPLAQRCRRLGRYVIALGVAGSTAKSLAAACDEFESYENLPGVKRPTASPRSRSRRLGGDDEEGRGTTRSRSRRGQSGADGTDSAETSESRGGSDSSDGSGSTGSRRSRGRKNGAGDAASTGSEEIEDRLDDTLEDEGEEDPRESATRLLERALQLGGRGDSEWLHSSAVKSHMRRMDPSFSEKALGYRSFSDFLKANSDIAVLEETGHERLVRARD